MDPESPFAWSETNDGVCQFLQHVEQLARKKTLEQHLKAGRTLARLRQIGEGLGAPDSDGWLGGEGKGESMTPLPVTMNISDASELASAMPEDPSAMPDPKLVAALCDLGFRANAAGRAAAIAVQRLPDGWKNSTHENRLSAAAL